MKPTAIKRDHGHRLSILSTALALILVFSAVERAPADFVVISPPSFGGEEFSFEALSNTFVHYFGDNFHFTGAGNSSFSSGTGYNATAADSASMTYTVTPTSFSATAQMMASTSVTNTDTSGLTFQVNAGGGMSYFAFSTDRPTLATLTFNPTLSVTSSNLIFGSPSSDASASVNASISLDGSDGSDLTVSGTYGEEFPDDLTYGYLIASSTTGAPSSIYTQTYGDSVSMIVAPGTYVLSFGAESEIVLNGDPTGSVSASTMGMTSQISLDPLATPEPSGLLLAVLGAASVLGLPTLARRKKRS